MIKYVIDASSVGPLIIPDEAENLLPAVMEALTQEECTVPGHWRFEIANLAVMAVRRERADLQTVLSNLHDLSQFQVKIDAPSSELVWTSTCLLAERHRLTVYDAAYLELAQRRALTLLSCDKALVRAATCEGVATDQAK